MKLRSFRLRLTLLAATLAGLSLAAFASAAWWVLLDSARSKLDAEMRAQLAREVSRPQPPEHWARVDDALRSVFRSDSDSPNSAAVLLITDREGDEVYRSARWPSGLRADALPQPALPPDPRLLYEPFRPEFAPQDGPRRPPPEDRPPGRSGENAQRPLMRTVAAADGRHFRFVAVANRQGRAFLGVDLTVIDAQMRPVRNALLLAFPLSLGLIALGSWYVSTRALAPVHRLTTTIRGVTATGLSRRVETRDEDVEFAELIEVFNRMLERLERSFQQASRFSSDAAHELKTPLAVLQGEIERAMSTAEPGSPLQRQFSTLLDEVRRLHNIVHKLLMLSRADAGRLALARAPFDLRQVLSEIAEDVALLAPGIELEVTVAPGLRLNGDAELLKQALHNLIGNAVKYNSDARRGWVRVRAAPDRAQIRIEVANSSQGIPPEHREKIFERFFRADTARGRKVDGLGLGLPLAREIARAHGGDLALARSAPGEVAFVFALPA